LIAINSTDMIHITPSGTNRFSSYKAACMAQHPQGAATLREVIARRVMPLADATETTSADPSINGALVALAPARTNTRASSAREGTVQLHAHQKCQGIARSVRQILFRTCTDLHVAA
jgi:hypothetical protein